MNIQSQQVEGTMKDYLKKGALNVWQHQVVYVIPMLLLLATAGLIGVVPSYIKGPFLYLTGIFYIFWFMEITFSTTQEKYNPKKYFASLLITIYSMVGFVKRHILFISVIIISSIVFDVFMLVSKGTIIQVDTMNISHKYILGILRYASANGLIDICIIGWVAREVISDYFVTQRMTGLKVDTPRTLTATAFQQNALILRKFMLTGSIFTMIAPSFFGLQVIIFAIMIAALTFYSMEVFGVDVGKKLRQEETEREKKAMENMIPIPLK